uniref:Uncharacterized protein n=1 Tax=Paracoccus methylutens TaxID=135742 RepID=Q7WTS7_9RHOB|nr:unknown [Paracoccus methylutens]
MFKAAIRVNKFTSIAQLRGASLHAQRHDETGKARVREDAEPGFGRPGQRPKTTATTSLPSRLTRSSWGPANGRTPRLPCKPSAWSPRNGSKRPATCMTLTTRITASSSTRQKHGRRAGAAKGR